MVVEYVRVRKSNIKELEHLLQKHSEPHWWVLLVIFGAVAAVAVTGMILVI